MTNLCNHWYNTKYNTAHNFVQKNKVWIRASASSPKKPSVSDSCIFPALAIIIWHALLSIFKTQGKSVTTYFQFYIQLCPWSIVLLEKLKAPQLARKLPEFYKTRSYIAAFKRTRCENLKSWVSSHLKSHLLYFNYIIKFDTCHDKFLRIYKIVEINPGIRLEYGL
jgi:hypothetical protein